MLTALRNNLQTMQTLLQNATAVEVEDRNMLVLLHSECANVYAAAKVLESMWRNKVASEFFPEHVAEGTENFELGEGWKINAIFKQSYKVDEKTVKNDIQEICNLGFAQAAAVEGLIKWKPEVSTTIYKTLSDEIKDVINNSLTIKPGTPTIKLISPKGEE